MAPRGTSQTSLPRYPTDPQPALPPTSPPRRSRSRSSSDERKGRLPGAPSLLYELRYDHEKQHLILVVKECRDLKKGDLLGKGADAVVSIFLLPGNHKELKTKVVKGSANPVFNESFQFGLRLQDAIHRTIVLQVDDWDRFSKNDSIGEVQIPLNTVDFGKTTREWRGLQPVMHRPSPKKSRQSVERRASSSDEESKSKKGLTGPAGLKYRIHYDHQAKCLALRVIGGRNLGKADLLGGKPDSFVDVSLSPGSHKEMKTKTIKNNSNPAFHEEFIFNGALDEISQKSFVLRVWDYDMLSKNDPIGEVVVPLWQVDLSRPSEEWRDLQKMTAKPKESKPARKDSSSSSDEEKRRSKTSTGPASLCYSVGYEQTSQTLVANVIQCRNLKGADLLGGKADAVVHVSLGEKEFKTKVVKGNNNPEINETFRFPLPAQEKTMHTLYFQVYDWDRFSKNDAIGEVAVYLGETDLNNRSPMWSVLQPMSMKKKPATPKSKAKPPTGPARICYQVQYNGATQTLQVTSLQAENLAKADLLGGAPDSYVCTMLLPSTANMQTSNQVKSTANPTYNHTVHFKVSPAEVANKTVVLQVFDKDTFSKDDPLGEVQIPLWHTDVYKATETWTELQPMSGVKGKPVLRAHPPPISSGNHSTNQALVTTTTTTNNGRRSRSSSSSSSDEEKRVSSRPSIPKPRSRSSSSSSNSSRASIAVVPQNMNLEQLNELLLKYIDQVRYLESRQDMQGSFTVNVDRSEIDALHGQYNGQLSDWRARCEAAEAKHAAANIQVETLQGLEREVARLQAEVDRLRREGEEGRRRSSSQEAHYRTTEQELKNRIAILETELRHEKNRGQVDMSSLDSKLQGEYEARLKAEVRNLRKMYEEQMRVAQAEWLKLHQSKLAELEAALARERGQNSSSGVEARELRVLVEELRRKMEEVEESNRKLGLRSSQLSVQLQEATSMHNAKMAAKDKEIEDLKYRVVEVQRQYEEIYGTKLEDLQEVKVYSGIIMPEIQRMTRHTEKVEKERRKSRAKGLSSSSSSSDDEKKAKKKSNGKGVEGVACIAYQLNFEQTSQTLVVTILQCRNLKNADLMGGKADAVIHVRLGDKEMKTKVVKENNNPEIQETFRFPHSPASKQPLLLQVYDWDRFSKNDLMGEVIVPLR